MAEQQLVMIRRDLENIAEMDLPEGYRIRFFTEGDAERLTPIFQQCFDPGWSADRVVKTFTDEPVWSPNRMCVLVKDDQIVGTATAWESRQRPDHGLVHYVAVLPEHRGQHLGRALVIRVLELLRELGYTDAWLSTDDHRLSAIRTYLRLGFEPVHTDASHAERWQIVRHKLKAAQTK